MPISHHFQDCTALLVWRFVVDKWRYIKYEALPFYLYSSVMPVLIIVLCLVVLKACVSLFVFNYTVAVLVVVL